MSANQLLALKYRETAVKTANPMQLIVMLYDAAICSLKEAREHMNRKDIAKRSRSINKCIHVISELQSCLDLKAGGEIASSLNKLYDYMKKNIFKANVEQSVQPLDEVEILLEGLRSAWNEVAAHTRAPETQSGGQSASPSGIIDAAAPVAMELKSLNLSI
jgi:flagellar protein FliS